MEQEIYMKKLPKDCRECPCNNDIFYCNLLKEEISPVADKRCDNCPLKSLYEYKSQIFREITDNMTIHISYNQGTETTPYISKPYISKLNPRRSKKLKE